MTKREKVKKKSVSYKDRVKCRTLQEFETEEEKCQEGQQ